MYEGTSSVVSHIRYIFNIPQPHMHAQAMVDSVGSLTHFPTSYINMHTVTSVSDTRVAAVAVSAWASVQVRYQPMGGAQVMQVGGVLAPPPHGTPLQYVDATDMDQLQCNKYWGQHSQVVHTAEHRGGRDKQARPQEYLPKVVWVSDNAPQPRVDPTVGISWLSSERKFLVVGDSFNNHAHQPDAPSSIVTQAERAVLTARVEDDGWRQGDPNPQGCKRQTSHVTCK